MLKPCLREVDDRRREECDGIDRKGVAEKITPLAFDELEQFARNSQSAIIRRNQLTHAVAPAAPAIIDSSV